MLCCRFSSATLLCLHFTFPFSILKEGPEFKFLRKFEDSRRRKAYIKGRNYPPTSPGENRVLDSSVTSVINWETTTLSRRMPNFERFLSKVIVDNSIRHSRLRIIKPCTERFKPHIMAVVTEVSVAYSPVAEGSASYLLPLGRRYQPQIAC